MYINCVFNLGFVSLSIHVICRSSITTDGLQLKTSILSMNVDKKIVRNRVLIAICRPTGDKWQSKTLSLKIFVLIRRLPPIRCGHYLAILRWPFKYDFKM